MTKLSDVPGVEKCTDSENARDRLALRDLLSLWGTSEMAARIPTDFSRIYTIDVPVVLFEAWRLTSFSYAVNRINSKANRYPIDVTQYDLFDLHYFIVNDGNHRAAAYCAHGRPLITARIRGIVDLTFAPMYIDEHNYMLLENEDGTYAVTGRSVACRGRKLARALASYKRVCNARVKNEVGNMRDHVEAKNVLQGKETRNKTRERERALA